MQVLRTKILPILTQGDIVVARKEVRAWAIEISLGLIDQTKVITAASELARNTLDYGGGGQMEMVALKNDSGKMGLRLIFEDHGPGISDIDQALTDGYTSGGGLGLGLSGSKRLMNEFTIESATGRGTRVTITKWK